MGKIMILYTKIGVLTAVAALAIFGGQAQAQTVATPYTYTTLLTVSSPVFNRPLAGTPPIGLSGTGTAVSYGTLTFVPDTTGSYTLETISATFATGTADDTFLILYEGTFDPLMPLVNALEADDDDGVDALSSMVRTLTLGTSYTLVTTSFNNGQFGPIDTRISGPGGSNLNLGSTSAPEPGTMALLALGTVGVLARRKRKTA
jgi:hypothetical protein